MAKKRVYEVFLTSDATITATFKIKASSPEEAVRIAVSGEVEAYSEETIDRNDRSVEVDGVDMDLPH